MAFQIPKANKILLQGKEAAVKQIENEIAHLKEQKERLDSQIKSRDADLSEIKKEAQTYSLLYSGYEITEKNSIMIALNNDTKTVPIIEEFCCSEKNFLIFNKIFYSHVNYSNRFSLVVSKEFYRVNHHGDFKNSMTMTDLKSYVGVPIGEYLLKNLKGSRMYPLFEELIEIGRNKQEHGSFVPFRLPCPLRGQRYQDREGFGSIYEGYELIKEKNYGDANHFYVIGVIVFNA